MTMHSEPNDETATRCFVLGMGCERGTAAEDALGLANGALRHLGISAKQLAGLASIETRREEPALLAVAAHFGVPLRFFSASRLEIETPRLKNPSELVFSRVGCHGVAEAAALAAAGPQAELVLAKIKSGFSTAAIAKII